MMMTADDVEQVDAVLSDDGCSVFFYGHTPDDDETFFWSVSLPMRIEDAAFDDMLPEWVDLGWKMLTQQE
ncbi:hypothetical protein [Rhizobium lentis]|uniref:hypothetical protein n=1 Tax=Rhizobium lentis TaxID=1138194 RepID=UPI002180AB67|nr:hypothetical protein [Rhizobium lentis]